MVTHINVAVDDDVADRAREIKAKNNWSWPQYFEASVERFEDDE